MKISKKGFTLVELLIVIGILGVLAATVVVVLNPAELLKQARDSQRVQDLASINSAVNLYAVATSSPEFTAAETIYSSLTSGNGDCNQGETAAGVNDRSVDGTGWVKVNLGSISGGSPLSVLPIDPTNNSDYHYCFKALESNATWELAAILESTKFATSEDLDGTDGGDDSDAYELGSDEDLDLI